MNSWRVKALDDVWLSLRDENSRQFNLDSLINTSCVIKVTYHQNVLEGSCYTHATHRYLSSSGLDGTTRM